MSDSGPLEDWQPSGVFANQKHREGLFAQSQEQAADPLIFQETPLVGLGEKVGLLSDALAEEAELEVKEEIEPLEPLQPIPSEQTTSSALDIEEAKKQAFAEGEAKGRADGLRLAREEFSEGQHQFEIEARDEIASFMSSIKSGLIKHNVLAEPLKRLAVRLAEIIARAELQLSDQSINNLIERVVSEIEPAEIEDAVITVSPGWYRRMTDEQFKGLFENCEIQVSEGLADGSIRLTMADRSIEDLLEDRITEIASQVFNARIPESTFITHEGSLSQTPAGQGDPDSSAVPGSISAEEIDASEEPLAVEEPHESSGFDDAPENDETNGETSFVLEPPSSDENSLFEQQVEEDG